MSFSTGDGSHSATTTLKFANDISVVVPDSLNLITTYVLREQGDWFEDEIKFVRLLLKANEKAINDPQSRFW